MDLNALLNDIVSKNPGLSDIHFKAGRHPLLRINGQLSETQYGQISKDLTMGMAKMILPRSRQNPA